MTNSSSREAVPATGDAASQLLEDAEARLLVRAAQQYDDRALARIYHLYAGRIFRYVFFRIGERNRAEDLTGEVFVRLLENVGSFQLGPHGHALALTGWIYRIAHNLIIDEYRRQKVRADRDPLPEGWEETANPDLSLDFHLTRADLQFAIRQLTDDQQTVILLRFDEGMTSAEIAGILGKTETAVKALQRRALATLARLLAPSPQPQA